MNRTPAKSPSSYAPSSFALSSFEYASARREAETLRRQEIARLIAAASERLQTARGVLAAVVRRTLARVRGAGEWTFFGAS